MRRKVVVGLVTLSLTVAGAVPASAAEPDLGNPQVVASGLTVPWGLDFLPDGSALVAERNSARILRLRPGSDPVPVATVPGVRPTGEAGLLGLAVSPTYAEDGYVYVYFTSATDNRIARLRLDAPDQPQVILSGLAKASIHDGGRIAFGPDGMLYAGVGDASNTANSQNPDSLNGKVLRMRPDGGVPESGNPFPGSLVYSLGHRNVQGLAWDAAGRMYVAELGQNTGTRSTRSSRATTTAGRSSRAGPVTPASTTRSSRGRRPTPRRAVPRSTATPFTSLRCGARVCGRSRSTVPVARARRSRFCRGCTGGCVPSNAPPTAPCG